MFSDPIMRRIALDADLAQRRNTYSAGSVLAGSSKPRSRRHRPYDIPPQLGDTVECRWAGCGSQVVVNTIGQHIQEHLGGVMDVLVSCAWEGCSDSIKPGSVPRHIKAHLGVSCTQCPGCGRYFSRQDATRRHMAVCRGRAQIEATDPQSFQ
jgi:hypothetical protein